MAIGYFISPLPGAFNNAALHNRMERKSFRKIIENNLDFNYSQPSIAQNKCIFMLGGICCTAQGSMISVFGLNLIYLNLLARDLA